MCNLVIIWYNCVYGFLKTASLNIVSNLVFWETLVCTRWATDFQLPRQQPLHKVDRKADVSDVLFVLISETVSWVSERWPQWGVGALQVWPDQRGGDPVHVRRHQRAAQRRGRVHQQRRPGSSRVSVKWQNQRLEEHAGCKSLVSLFQKWILSDVI